MSGHARASGADGSSRATGWPGAVRRCMMPAARPDGARQSRNRGKAMSSYVKDVMSDVESRNPGELEFHQAVREVADSIEICIERHPVSRTEKILERIVEPERVILFRVPWV